MAGPLEGIRVVDCSRGLAGSRLTWFFADNGADVIWVEPPGGDPYRDDLAVPYAVYNRNKRSVELDLRDAAGRESLYGLLETADVFVQTWRPGVAERLGLGYDEVHARVPGLVYCAISGEGPGSTGDLPGYGSLVHAAAGMMGAQMGHRPAPIFLALPQACNGAAYMALIGILAALYRREDDGWGRQVETSLVDGICAYMAQGWGYSEAEAAMDPLERLAAFGMPRFVTRTYLCADEEWLGLSSFGRGAFDRLMKVLGLEDRVPPVEGANAMAQLTPEEAQIVFMEIPEIFLTKPRQEWLDALLEADIAVIPVLKPGEVFDEPQAVHNGMAVTLEDPVLGPIEAAAPPLRFEATPPADPRPAPTPGQHTDEVLAEVRSGTRRTATPSGAPDERPLLDGVHVLDLGHWYAGPFSSRLLAGLGADVVKLEPPTGDGMRGFDRAFAAAQAGKRAIAADLKDGDLADLRRRLVEWADVIHHNLRMGVLDRLGLGYEEVQAIKPDVVYLDAPGWGSSGPEVLRQSFAPLMSGYVGAAYELGGFLNPPIYPAANEDSGAGMLGGAGLLMALLHRKRTGVGQRMELPQLNSTISDVAHIVRRPDGTVLGGLGLDTLQYGTGPLSRLYETADGWVCIVAATDAEFDALAKVLALDVADDDRFRTRAGRAEHAYDLGELLAERIAGEQTAKLIADLRAAGVPAVEPVLDGNKPMMDDPANHELGRVAAIDHPRFGPVKEVARPFRVSATDMPAHRRAPEFGEHTEELLSWAGYAAEQIEALRARGAVR